MGEPVPNYEQWAPIDGFPNYAVSNWGNVINLNTGRLLTPRMDGYRNCRVLLYYKGHSAERLIHHLVAAAFMSNYAEGVSIKHVDNDNANNHVLNLRFRKDRGLGQYREKQPEVRHRRIRVVNTGQVFRTVGDVARYLQADSSNIYKVLRGERTNYRGLQFEYCRENEIAG